MPVFALVGKKLGHSFSKAWFTAKFEREGLSNFHYLNIETDNIADIRTLVAEHSLSGFNITIPYKTDILPLLDELDETAAAIGAVNTVKRIAGGKLTGYNTDSTGFRETLRPHLKACHSHALIFGTGGAARAVAYVLKELGIEYQLVSRNAKAPGILEYRQLTSLDIRNAPLLVNASPLGTFPEVDGAPDIPYAGIEKFHLLYDLVYHPAETKFLALGARHGAATVNGYAMLVRQAEESWKIWQSA